ncbi:MAG TPA: hypothetical protein VL832_28290 [Puia sp.]|nr:hypothetical protein [Puia sp.]
MNKNDIRERLISARKSLPGRVNPRQFAKGAQGVDVSQYTKYEKGGPLGMDKIMELCSKWGINGDWIATGKGNMFVTAHLEPKQREKPIGVDYEAEFSEAMKTIRGYNDFLQDMLKSSLGKLLEGQIGNSALMGILLRRDIDREANGNPEKEKEILNKILQKIGPKLNSDLKEGIGADGHT